MIQLEEDINKIVGAFKENLYYIEQALPKPDSKFPALRVLFGEIQSYISNGHPIERTEIEFQIFAPFPPSCKSFEEVRQAVKYDTADYQSYIRSITEILTNNKYGFRYNRLIDISGVFRYKLAPYQVTENNYFVVTAKGLLIHPANITCCEDQLFDLSQFKLKAWGV